MWLPLQDVCDSVSTVPYQARVSWVSLFVVVVRGGGSKQLGGGSVQVHQPPPPPTNCVAHAHILCRVVAAAAVYSLTCQQPATHSALACAVYSVMHVPGMLLCSNSTAMAARRRTPANAAVEFSKSVEMCGQTQPLLACLRMAAGCAGCPDCVRRCHGGRLVELQRVWCTSRININTATAAATTRVLTVKQRQACF